MLNQYKLIGLCLADMEDNDSIALLRSMQEQCCPKSARFLVISAAPDNTQDDDDISCAFSVFSAIDYRILDYLVIFCPGFSSNPSRISEIIKEAKKYQIPVVTLCQEYEGCRYIAAPVEDHLSDLHDMITEGASQTIQPARDYTPLHEQSALSRLNAQLHHEKEIFTMADRLLSARDHDDFIRLMRQYLLPDSVMLLTMNPEILVTETPQLFDSESWFTVFSSSAYAEVESEPFKSENMLSILSKALDTHDFILFRSVYANHRLFGFYAVSTNDPEQRIRMMYRLCHVLNLVLHVVDVRRQNEITTSQLTRLKSMDAQTGLLSLNGLSNYLTDHYQVLALRFIAVSVYEIDQYQHILETESLEYVDQLVNHVSTALTRVNSDAVLARISASTFAVFNHAESRPVIANLLEESTSAFFTELDRLRANVNPEKKHLLVHNGCVVSRPGWENNLLSFIKAATGEMYLNTIKKQRAREEGQVNHAINEQFDFKTLLENNLFHYYFQPIVSAHTGKVYAYEALMRTKDPVHMSPMQVLDTASRMHKLYDVEHATFFNVMDYIGAHQEELKDKRVFINTIPGHFLNKDDCKTLNLRYGEFLEQCTIEITESDDIDDEELTQIRRFDNADSPYQLAIDDYGTGFSNIVNLLRYQPQVIKIDHYLVHDVHLDTNKQLFIRSTIEFAKMNNILVLGEGVETKAELSKLIEMGVDLVQGFLVARPSPDLVQSVPEDICNFMISETIRFSKFGIEDKVYHAHNGETIELIHTAVEKYTSVFLGDGDYRIIGQGSHYIGTPLVIEPDTTCHLTIENTYIGASGPAITLGAGSTLELNIIGNNAFNYSGIKVPKDATLILSGPGNLDINSIQKRGAVLGGDTEASCGAIRIDITGTLSITASSEYCLCIGAGRDVQKIDLISGTINLDARGIRTVAIGSIDGHADIDLHRNVNLIVHAVGKEGVAIGSLNGSSKVRSEGETTILMEGENICGMGNLHNGHSECRLTGRLNATMRGANSVCIGSYNGSIEAYCHPALMQILMEGAEVCPIGSFHGNSQSAITGGAIRMTIHSGNPYWNNGSLTISGGCFDLDGDIEGFSPVSPFGEKLIPISLPDRHSIETRIATETGSYDYQASCVPEIPDLCVYVPENSLNL